MISRRGLLIGASSLLAAPAIVKAENIMRINDPLVRGIHIFDDLQAQRLGYGFDRLDTYIAYDPFGVTRHGFLYMGPFMKKRRKEWPSARLSEFQPLIKTYKELGWYSSHEVVY